MTGGFAVPPASAAEKLRRTRTELYAAGAHTLRGNLWAPNADGIFDQALTNGLLAVVADTIAGHKAAKASGFMPSARNLLVDLADKFGKDAGGSPRSPPVKMPST